MASSPRTMMETTAMKSSRRRRYTPTITITRRIGVYEVLDEEGLATIERNADIILAEIGIEYRDDPEALAKWQRADKTLYSPVPSGNWGAELPPQMLASVGKYGFWLYYFNTGDAETMRVVYPHVRDYLTVWKQDENGLVVHRKGEWDWSDWGRRLCGCSAGIFS
jgi:hypothetical protein